jgi:hypothetical protein
MRAALVAIALAACARPEPPPPLTGRAPDTPPPTVAWRGHDIAITITGLPAIAGDGSSIVIAHRDSDGGRGNPNLTLVEKDRGDRVVRQLAVITATEVDELPAAAIARRFAAAAAWLDERHAAAHLVALAALELHPGSDEAPPSASGDGALLRWVPSALELVLGSASRVLRSTPPSWLVADRPMCPGCTEVCHNDAFLGGGYLDRDRRAALVVVSYRGSDTCWEPGSEAHVVAW